MSRAAGSRRARAIGAAIVSLSFSACSLAFDARGVANDYEPRRSPDASVSADAAETAKIVTFTVAPQSIARGDTAVLRWETQLGAALEISESGAVIFSSQDRGEVARGWLLVDPNEPVTYTLTLNGSSDGDFDTRSQSLLVLVPAIEAPAITSFRAMPRTFAEGDAGPFAVMVDWSTNAADKVELGSVSSSQVVAPTSSDVVTVAGTTELELTATNARGSIFATQKVWTVVREVEPNNDATLAASTQGVATRAVLDDDLNSDWFSVRLPADGSSIAAEVASLGRGCHPDARLTLYRADGTLLGFAGGEPLSPCAELDPKRRGFTRNLPGGNYLLAVEPTKNSFGDPDYELFVSVLLRRAGNHILEDGEECDDGDRVVDDGCDELGFLEPGYAYSTELLMPKGAPPDHATALTFEPYPAKQTTPGVGFVVVPLDSAVPFFGSNYAALIVHSNGLITFSRRTIDEPPEPRRAFPDPSLAVAAIAAFAGDLAGRDTGVEALTWTFEDEGERWTAIELRNVTARLAPDRGLLSISGRVSISESGIIDLAYVAKTNAGGGDLPLAAGIQDARGRIGNPIPSCAELCSVSRLPVEGSVIRFQPRR